MWTVPTKISGGFMILHGEFTIHHWLSSTIVLCFRLIFALPTKMKRTQVIGSMPIQLIVALGLKMTIYLGMVLWFRDETMIIAAQKSNSPLTHTSRIEACAAWIKLHEDSFQIAMIQRNQKAQVLTLSKILFRKKKPGWTDLSKLGKLLPQTDTSS